MPTNHVSKLIVAESVIESARTAYKPHEAAVLWSGGKDSTALLFMMKKLYGKVPFTVVYGDFNFGSPVLEQYIQATARQLSFSFIREEILDRETAGRLRLSGDTGRLTAIIDASYARSLKRLYKEKKIRAFIFGNRYQENKRNNAFTKRENGVTSYYPLLQMTDMDMWKHIYRTRIPFLEFYRRGWRRTGPVMFLREPTPINRIVSRLMHTYLQIRYSRT